jgi:hypothetical protein
MHIYGGSLRSVGAVGRAFSAAFLFFALLSTSAIAASDGGLPSIQLTQLPGSLESPLDMVNAGDGSGRLFVVEQTGHIRVFKNGAFNATDFLDIHTIVSYDGGEKGLLGAAFHPNYGNNGYFFVYYTDFSVPTYNLTIARYTVSGNPDVPIPRRR